MKFPRITTRKVFFVILSLVVIVGLLYWRILRKKNGLEKDIVKRGDVIETLVLSGEIEAQEHVSLSFETSGKIVFVGVKEGDSVKKGQILGKLDTTVLNSNYQQTLATLRKYEATVENVHDQVKDHGSDETYSQKDFRTTAEVNKDNAYEAVIIAERNLKGATITAPFAGIVTYVANPYPGAFVLSTEKQFEVINPETIYFKVAADQTEVVQIKVGQEVSIVLDAFPEREIKGRIKEISFVPDPKETGVIYPIKVELEDSVTDEGRYRLGMTGDASFVLKEIKDVLYVPPKFVKSGKDGKYVLTNGGKKKVMIETGIGGEDRIEIKGDIKEGEVIYD